MLNSTLNSLRTPPPTQGNNSDDIIIDMLVYLFALLCAQNTVCSSTFRVIFAVILEGLSGLVASIPVLTARENDVFGSRPKCLTFTKATMAAAWVGSNYAGYATYKQVYDLDMDNAQGTSTVEKFEANSDALFSYALVTLLYSAAAACVFATGRKVADKSCCKQDMAATLGYNRM